jgi:hypothetical protein
LVSAICSRYAYGLIQGARSLASLRSSPMLFDAGLSSSSTAAGRDNRVFSHFGSQVATAAPRQVTLRSPEPIGGVIFRTKTGRRRVCTDRDIPRDKSTARLCISDLSQRPHLFFSIRGRRAEEIGVFVDYLEAGPFEEVPLEPGLSVQPSDHNPRFSLSERTADLLKPQ